MKKLPPTLVAIYGLFLVVDPAFAQTWTQTGAPATNQWQSIASSADGSRLVAASQFYSQDSGLYTQHSLIYTSTNSGATWAPNLQLTNWIWESVASSADGSKLVASAGNGIYTSRDAGVTWTQTSAPNNFLGCVASSADGSTLVAAAGAALNYAGPIYISTNSGGSWTQTSAPTNSWDCVASSADGSKLVAAAFPGAIYTSSDTGATWTVATNAPCANWVSVASSADGTKLVAGVGFTGPVYSSPIYTSIDSGATWTEHNFPPYLPASWQGIASSADGTKLVAVAQGSIYTSTDSGTTWTSNNAPAQVYWCVASSADGGKLVAGSYGDVDIVNGGGTYSSQTAPSPQLNLALANPDLKLSWIVPSTDLVLQQNLDLATTNWTDVTNPPVLNLTNLQNEVILSPTNRSAFYRLKTP